MPVDSASPERSSLTAGWWVVVFQHLPSSLKHSLVWEAQVWPGVGEESAKNTSAKLRLRSALVTRTPSAPRNVLAAEGGHQAARE